ncbi:MAG: MFS transporter, partial [Fidelibacterota bacterium]
SQPRLGRSLWIAFKNRPFVFGMVLFLLTWVAVEIVQATLLFFIKYVVQREAENELIMAVIFVTALLTLPFWQWASRRWNKRRAYVGGIAFWAVVQIALISLNPATGLNILLVLCVLAGIGVAAAHVLPWAILPDTVEWGEWQSGERNEGMLYSLVTLIRKVATSLAVPMVGVLLEFTGYVPNVAQQADSALLGIRIAIGPIPAVLLVAGILFAILFPLGREEHTRLVAELEERRAQIGKESS